jgi:hypothetical protein
MAPPSQTPIHTKRHRPEEIDCFLDTPSAITANQDVKLTKMSELIVQLSKLVDGVNEKLTRDVSSLHDEVGNLINHNMAAHADTVYVKLNQEVSTLHGEINKLQDTNYQLRCDVNKLMHTCEVLTNHIERLTAQDTVEMTSVEDKSTDNAKSDAINTESTITINTVQNSVETMLLLHDKLKDKMVTNLRKFSEHDLKNNTKTQQEYQEFKEIRKNLNKWYISCQIVKKNMASTEQINKNHYLNVQWNYSQAVVNDAKLKQLDNNFKQNIIQTDLTLKQASLESNITLIDKLTASFSDGTKDLLYAKAFKGIIKSHKNLADNVLFRRRPNRPNQPTSRAVPNYHTRRVAREDIVPPRHTERYDEEFPSLDGETHWEDDDEIFDRRVQYRPTRQTYRRSSQYQQRPRYESYARGEPEYEEYHPQRPRYAGEEVQTHFKTRRNSHYGRLRNDSLYAPQSVNESAYCY